MASFAYDFAGDGPLPADLVLINGSGVERVSGQARTTTGNGRDQVIWAGECDTLDQYSQITMDCDNGEITAGTLRSTGTYVFPWTDGYTLFYWPAFSTLWLRKNTGGGAGSDIASVGIGDLTGLHVFRLEAEDVGGSTELRAYVDDLVTPVLTHTDATPLTGMKVGFGWGFFSSSAMRGIADDFSAGDLTGPVVPAEGSVTGSFSWGPGVVTGARASSGSVSGTVTRGPGVVTGVRTPVGSVAGAVAWGPGSVAGERDSVGSVLGANHWGPGVVVGVAPSVDVNSGVVLGSFLWGPGVVEGVRQPKGSVAGTVLRGPGVVTGLRSSTGAVAGQYRWGPGLVTGFSSEAGVFPPPWRTIVVEAENRTILVPADRRELAVKGT